MIGFAILNRARGSKLYGLTASTQVARSVSTFLMAAITATDLATFLWCWATLYLWALPGWGKYAGAAIGAGLNRAEKEFAPVDWIMSRTRIANDRLWGAVAMSLRMLLALPFTLGMAYLTGGSYWPSLIVPLMGLVYLPCGWLFGTKGWAAGEYAAGAVLGVIASASVGE